MAGITTSSKEIAGHLGELVGYKAGLALTREELADHLVDTPYIRDAVLVIENRLMRIRSEEYEEAVSAFLYRVGNIPTPQPLSPIQAVRIRFEHNPPHSEILGQVVDRCLALLPGEVRNTHQGGILRPKELLLTIAKEFGSPGADIVKEFFKALTLQQHTSPWSLQRSFDWKDTVQLRDLFMSENLETQHGRFFDQRFVDYLARNFQRIDEIHWRQFEGLTGEFFEQAGFQVELGPGRGDGGVDVRVWASEGDVEKPPLILVQCKRWQDKVGDLIVKALWADVSHEGAQSGLIVTTSALTPGAEDVRKTRGYPIMAAERPMLEEWLKQLRSPGTGTFLA